MTTQPAGEDLTDEEAVAEVAQQTDPDLKAEAVFKRERDGANADTPAENLDADDV